MVAVLGTNGAGKSTLLRAVAGLVHPHRGVIRLFGANCTYLEPEQVVRQGAVLLSGGKMTFPGLSVRDNLLIGEQSFRRERPRVRAAFDEAVALFPELEARLDQRAGTLSGGEQQMLTIARALMMKPKLLMLDEPTLGLAPVILEQISKALDRLRQSTAITVLLAEQNVSFALPHADRVYVLEHARIVWEGGPAKFAAEMGTGYL